MNTNVIIIHKRVEINALVPSESVEGAFYRVQCDDGEWTCSCPDHRKRKHHCKHIDAVSEGNND